MRQISRAYAGILRLMRSYGEHDGAFVAAAISFYGLLSLFPMLLATVGILDALFPTAPVLLEMMEQMNAFAPGSGALIGATVGEALRSRPQLSVLAGLTLLWSASGAFSAISRALNRIYEVKKPRHFIGHRLMALLVASLGVVAFMSPFVISFAVQLGEKLPINILGLKIMSRIPFWRAVSNAGPFLMTLAAFTLIYWRLPNHQPRRTPKEVLPGALVGAIAFEVVKRFFIWYIPNLSRYQLVYGSLAAVVVLLMWFYVGSSLLLVGAEISAAYPWTGPGWGRLGRAETGERWRRGGRKSKHAAA